MGLEKQQETHRPGALKQTNKGHKHGRHRSKGSISQASKGKVNLKTFSKKNKQEMNKDDRRHQAQQIRRNKRDELQNKQRAIDQAPCFVCILPLHQHLSLESTITQLQQCDSEAIVQKSASGVIHINLPRFKKRFALVAPAIDNKLAILDTLKVCDSVLFVISAAGGIEFGAEAIDAFGNNLLISAFSQGLCTPTIAVTDLNSLPVKKQNVQKQNIQKMISKWLPEEKVITLDKDSDGINLFRKIGNQKRRRVAYRDRRPYLYAENYEYTEGELKITGYLRGAALSVNSLIHLPCMGTFQMSQIDAPYDPLAPDKKNSTKIDTIRILEKADATKQESLVSENIPDPMNAEQTFPTEDEIMMAQEETKVKRVKKIPKGWSEYQAAWIPDDDAEDVSDVDEDDSGNDDMEGVSDEESAEEKEDDEEFDTVSQSDIGINDQQYDQQMDFHTELSDMQKLKDAKMDQMFPDELDTPQDIAASIRFQKYRGLESFRSSPWDPKENLPLDYARIFQFENFDKTKRRVLKDQAEKEGALPGWFITVHVTGVSQYLWDAFQSTGAPVILMGLLPHENKMSVLNVVLKRTGLYDQPIKSKEKLIFQCGYRRFIVNPIFSQHTNGKKHKFERFFQPDTTAVATFYAPIQFPPAPVLCFKELNGELKLVATGSLLSCNPDRIIAKRIVLSGHPFKVHKRSAVIRFMFFNREDVIYFKPCKLSTKHGRTGHIKEPLGTHGHMKCVFDGQLKSQDTILLNLYKRMFPKWTYEECIVSCNNVDGKMEI